MNSKQIIKFSIFLIVGTLIVYFISKSFNFNDFLINIKSAKLPYIIAGVLVGVLAVFIRALRWQLMLEPMGYKTSLSNAYHATMSGYLVNLGIPRSGEVYRCAVFSKTDKVPLNTLIGSVFSERIIDLIMLVVVLVLSVFIQFDILFDYFNTNVLSKLNAKILIVLVIVFILGLVFLFKFNSIFKSESKLGKLLKGFVDGLKSVFAVKKPILFIVYTFSIWVCYLLMTYFVVVAFEFSSGLGIGGALSCLVFSTLGVIVPAPGGIATISSIQLGLEQIYNISQSNANTFAIVMFFSNIGMIIIAGTISFVVMAIKTKV